MKYKYRIKKILLFISMIGFFTNCGKSAPNIIEEIPPEAPPTAIPTITSPEITASSTTQATLKAAVEHTGGAAITTRGICWATHDSPTIEDLSATPEGVSGSGNFEVILTGLAGGTTYYARAYAINSVGTGYSDVLKFTTERYEDAKVSDVQITFYNLHSMQAVAEIIETGGADVAEAGFCYAESENPTLTDTFVQASNITNKSFRVDITDLALNKRYYIRSYVRTAKGVFFGNQQAFQTYPKGKITVNFHNPENIPADVLARLKEMAAHGVRLLEEHTSIVKTVTIEYNPGVPTADASISGWMRWGANVSYQKTGTFLHEFSHTIGTGQSSMWTNSLIQNGLYTGKSANLALQKATNDPSAQLRGDAQHWWPYGINGAHEDTGRESDYIVTTLIMEGFRRDGIPIN